MYSGLLPKGLTEDDLSPDDGEDDEGKKRLFENNESAVGKLNSTWENTASVLEKESVTADSDGDSDFPTCSMPGVSQEMWQVGRFRYAKG